MHALIAGLKLELALISEEMAEGTLVCLFHLAMLAQYKNEPVQCVYIHVEYLQYCCTAFV